MDSRITNISMSDKIMQSIYTNRSKLSELNDQLATGKQVSRPSDDATATINILNSNSTLNKIDSYQNNISNANSEMSVTEGQLTSVTDIIQKAKELAIQASNATTGPTELASIKSEIDQMIENLKDLGNTKFGSKYIFGGVNTDAPPFVQTAEGGIDYNGTLSTDNYKRKTEISDNITVEMNVAGDEIFGYYSKTSVDPDPVVMEGKGLMNTLKTLSNELATDPPDYEKIRAKIDDIETSLETVLNVRTKLGSVSNRLEMTKAKLNDDTLNFTKLKSSYEDIDMAKVISDIQFQQTSLQASLQVGSKLIQTSLMDYI